VPKHFEMSNYSLGLLEQIINNISDLPEVAYCVQLSWLVQYLLQKTKFVNIWYYCYTWKNPNSNSVTSRLKRFGDVLFFL